MSYVLNNGKRVIIRTPKEKEYPLRTFPDDIEIFWQLMVSMKSLHYQLGKFG